MGIGSLLISQFCVQIVRRDYQVHQTSLIYWNRNLTMRRRLTLSFSFAQWVIFMLWSATSLIRNHYRQLLIPCFWVVTFSSCARIYLFIHPIGWILNFNVLGALVLRKNLLFFSLAPDCNTNQLLFINFWNEKKFLKWNFKSIAMVVM